MTKPFSSTCIRVRSNLQVDDEFCDCDRRSSYVHGVVVRSSFNASACRSAAALALRSRDSRSTRPVSRLRRQTFFPALATVCCCVVLVCGLASAALAQETADEPPPTSLEQTLADHVCTPIPSADAHEQCVGLQFRALRAEFGYNLSKLSPAERGHVDSTCSRLRRPENVEPYLNCVTSFLVAAREQRRGASGMAPAAVGDAAFGVPSLPVSSPAPPPSRGRFGIVLLVLFGVGMVAAAASVAVIRTKKRTTQPPRVCQKCGGALNTIGELCSSCRHEAGVAAKQAIAERAAEERAEQERKRVELEQLEQRRRQLEEQVAEAERHEHARLQAEARRQADAAQCVAELARTPVPTTVAIGADAESESPCESDPYAVLGVSRGASRQDIEHAYCIAASKYDETQVAHLGDAVQAHYRAKAEAVDHAYRTLIGTAA